MNERYIGRGKVSLTKMHINRNTPKLPNTGLAEKREAKPQVALLDDFDGDPVGFPHGQAVESVQLTHSDLSDADIQRYQNTPKQANLTHLIMKDGLDFPTAFKTMVARNIAHFYLGTATNLHKIHQEQPDIKVISQSQGETPGRHLEVLLDGLQNNPEFRTGTSQSLGLGPDASLKDICNSLLRAADQVMADNEFCQKARDEYTKITKKLYENGVTYLVAAGNHGNVGRKMERLGVEAGASVFRIILVNDYVTVVGALDEQGQKSSVNSPNSGAEVFRIGENLAWKAKESFNTEGVSSGTSFATPIAAAEVVQLRKDNPELSPFQIEGLLMDLDTYKVSSGETVPTKNGQTLSADGKVEPYIQDIMGSGFITDLASPDALQIAQANRDSTLFGLPGKQEHEFQVIKMRPDPDGVRVLTVETYFNQGHHVLRASENEGQWDQNSVEEELHLDSKRQKEIDSRIKEPKAEGPANTSS